MEMNPNQSSKNGVKSKQKHDKGDTSKGKPLIDNIIIQTDLIHNLHRSDLNSRMRMVTEALIACKKMTKHKGCHYHTALDYGPLELNLTTINESIENICSSVKLLQVPLQVLSPPRKQTIEILPEKKIPISYLDNMTKNLETKYFKELEENLPDTDISQTQEHSRPKQTASFVGFYNTDEVDLGKMVDLIQRELKTLMDMVPSMSLLIVEISDAIFHFKECSKCNSKFFIFLPRILNRIQKLIKYLTIKKGDTYIWPNDLNFLRIKPVLEVNKVEEESQTQSEPIIVLGSSEKVDALIVSGYKPGVQIQLAINIQEEKLRFFENIKIEKKWSQIKSAVKNCILIPVEYNYNLIEIKLRPLITPVLSVLQIKRVKTLKAISVAVNFIISVPFKLKLVGTVSSSIGFLRIIETRKVVIYMKETDPYEERHQTVSTSSFQIFTKQDGFYSEPRKVCLGKPKLTKKSEEDDVSLEVIKDLIEEGKKELKMQKMHELEAEVRGLKELIFEVYKNQMELSQILIDKEVFSQPIIDLTDPIIVEEENQLVLKVTQWLKNGSESDSVECLKISVEEQKKKCLTKNQMLITFLNGFQSNISKECWKNFIDSTFKKLISVDDLEPEKVSQFLNQLSAMLMKHNDSPKSSEQEPSKGISPEGRSSKKKLYQITPSQLQLIDSNKIPDNISKKKLQLIRQKVYLSRILEYRHSSSFIHNVLDEDSKAGTAVVDLFVAVKSVKDKFNDISIMNNELNEKMMQLMKESENMKTEYKTLTSDMAELCHKMNGTSKEQIQKASQKSILDLNDPKRGNKNFYLNNRLRLVEDLKELWSLMCKKTSEYKQHFEIEDPQLNDKTSEDIVGAIIVSFLRSKIEGSSEVKDFSADDLTMVDDFLQNEKNLEATCDTCKVVGLSRGEWFKKEIPKTLNCSNWKGMEHLKHFTPGRIICNNVSTSPNNGIRVTRRNNNKSQEETKEETASDEESVFEEALSEPVCELNSKPGTVVENRGENSGTLTEKKDVRESWIKKLKNDIKKKLSHWTPETKKKLSSEKDSDKRSKNLEPVEFTVSTDTPVGVFDVTIKEFQESRLRSRWGCSICTFKANKTSSKKRIGDTQSPKIITFAPEAEYYWSEDNMSNSDSDRCNSIPSITVTDGDEMEEFVTLTVPNVKPEPKEQKLESKQKTESEKQKGIWLKTLMETKVPIIEIQKYRQKYFVQEIIPKKALNKQKIEENPNATSMDNCDHDLLIFIHVKLNDEGEEEKNNIFIQYNHESENKTMENLGTRSDINSRISAEEEECDNEKEDSKISANHSKVQTKYLTPLSSATASEESYLRVNKEIKGNEFWSNDVSLRGSARVFEKTSDESDVIVIKHFFKEGQVQSTKVFKMSFLIWFVFDEKKTIVLSELFSVYPIFQLEPRLVENVSRTDNGRYIKALEQSSLQLEKALTLIHEIESNLMNVKLSRAILILPQLESELRKLTRVKEFFEINENSSGEEFYSSIDFNLIEDRHHIDKMTQSDPSECKLNNLFKLISNLEHAVRQDEVSSEELELGDCSSEKYLYQVYDSLVNSSKGIELSINPSSLKETEPSQPNTIAWETGLLEGVDKINRIKSNTDVCVIEKSQLNRMKTYRANVFQATENEIRETDTRMEKDLNRINKLERDNEETLKFVEAFLEKTQRRASELNQLKVEMVTLTTKLNEVNGKLTRAKGETVEKTLTVKEEEREAADENADTGDEKTSECFIEPEKTKSKEAKNSNEEKPDNVFSVQNTVSDLLQALETLKEKARKKNDFFKEIIDSHDKSASPIDKKNSKPRRNSSFFTENPEKAQYSILDFRKIGENSLYVSWAKPEGVESDSIVSYEILVNGKLNQKVRNPLRKQAVLYSVDLSKSVNLQLYGIENTGQKKLLAAMTQ